MEGDYNGHTNSNMEAQEYHQLIKQEIIEVFQLPEKWECSYVPWYHYLLMVTIGCNIVWVKFSDSQVQRIGWFIVVAGLFVGKN